MKLWDEPIYTRAEAPSLWRYCHILLIFLEQKQSNPYIPKIPHGRKRTQSWMFAPSCPGGGPSADPLLHQDFCQPWLLDPALCHCNPAVSQSLSQCKQPWHCHCPGTRALPHISCFLLATSSTLLIFRAKKKQSWCQEGRVGPWEPFLSPGKTKLWFASLCSLCF